MRKDKEQATVLRQSGMSYSDIKERMGVPKSTLSQWFHDQKWSNEIALETTRKARYSAAIRLTVLNTVRGSRLKKIYDDAKQDALTDFSELKYHPLFIAGVMGYWCHGDKVSKHRISFGSMDPKQVNIFNLFLIRVCSVKKVRVQLNLAHDFGREEEIRDFWIKKAGLQASDFIKTIKSKPNTLKRLGNKPYFGICNIIVNSAYLKNKILKWVELMAEEIGEEKYLDKESL